MPTSSASRLAPVVAVARRQGKLPLKYRLQRLRKDKLLREEMLRDRTLCIRRLKELIKSLQAKKKETVLELKSELHDRESYIDRLEKQVERHEYYMKKCMSRCPKSGDRYPSTPCTDCGKRFPITHFKLRIALGTGARHWTIIPNCRKCLSKRNKRIDEKRREINAALKAPIDDRKHYRDMAAQIVNGVHHAL